LIEHIGDDTSGKSSHECKRCRSPAAPTGSDICVLIETIFALSFNAMSSVDASVKYFTFFFTEFVFLCRHPASPRRGVRAVVTICEAGMRWAYRVAA
jgi:hypothetical protein